MEASTASRVPCDTWQPQEMLHTLAELYHIAPLWESQRLEEEMGEWRAPALLSILRDLMRDSGGFLCLQTLCLVLFPLPLPGSMF